MRPDRIETPSGDTIIVNADGPVGLPIRVVASDGRPLKRARVQYSIIKGTGLVAAGDTIACAGKGDAAVRVSSGRLYRDVVVLCRPFRAIWIRTPALRVGGTPQALEIGAVDERRQPVAELVFGLEVMDTTVVVARNGSLVPRHAGAAFVRVHVGRCMLDIHVRVVDSASRAPLAPPVRPPAIRRGETCPMLLTG